MHSLVIVWVLIILSNSSCMRLLYRPHKQQHVDVQIVQSDNGFHTFRASFSYNIMYFNFGVVMV